MSLVLVLAATIALRTDPPSITFAEARAMTPAQLADAVLAPGHPVVVAAEVGRHAPMPPPPPGASYQMPVTLVMAGDVSTAAGFCERSVAHVLLAPSIFRGIAAPLSPPLSLTIERTYSWRADARDRGECATVRKPYFSVSETDASPSFALIRQLATLQARARSHRSLPVRISIDDQSARMAQDFARINTDPDLRPSKEEMTVITSGRVALAKLPLDAIAYIHPNSLSYQGLVEPAERRDSRGTPRALATLLAGGEWTVDMALENGRIVVMRIMRRVPAPF